MELASECHFFFPLQLNLARVHLTWWKWLGKRQFMYITHMDPLLPFFISSVTLNDERSATCWYIAELSPSKARNFVTRQKV
jgi:hypothetical protein